MRTQDEILARLKERADEDMFGFETDEYYTYLDWQHAKEFVADGVSESDWTDQSSEHTRDHMIVVMKDYMPFAIEKAEGGRGISANRSIIHYIAWIWLACDDDFLAEVDKEYDDNYREYGLPILRKIAAFYEMET